MESRSVVVSNCRSNLLYLVAWLPLETWSLSSWGLGGIRSWSSSCTTFLVLKLHAQDCRLLLSWTTAFWTGITWPPRTSCRRSMKHWVHQDESQCFPFLNASLSMICHQIFGVASEGTKVNEINLNWIRGTRFRLVQALQRVIILRPVWLY
jgi:hypothetical protein